MSGAVRIGPRLLVCPYCTLTLYNAGPGRAFCEGNQNPPNAMQPHEEVEMVAYTVVAWKERDEALSRAEAAERDNRRLREALEEIREATANVKPRPDIPEMEAAVGRSFRTARKALAAPPEGATREEQT